MRCAGAAILLSDAKLEKKKQAGHCLYACVGGETLIVSVCDSELLYVERGRALSERIRVEKPMAGLECLSCRCWGKSLGL